MVPDYKAFAPADLWISIALSRENWELESKARESNRMAKGGLVECLVALQNYGKGRKCLESALTTGS